MAGFSIKRVSNRMSPLYAAGWGLCRFVFRLYFHWRPLHPERIPHEGGVLIACNHESVLDPPLVGAGINRAAYFLARQTLFHNPLFRKLCFALNAVPLDRDGGGAEGMKVVLDLMEKGAAVLMFPEGTRSRDGELQPLRSGIGMLVIRSSAVVIPARVFGAFEAYGRGKSFPRPARVTVIYGEPLDVSGLRAEAQNCSKQRLKEIYKEVAAQVGTAIAELTPEPAHKRGRPPDSKTA